MKDESCISNNLKSEISNWTSHLTVQFKISDLGFEMQDSSDFKIPLAKYFDGRLLTYPAVNCRPGLIAGGHVLGSLQ